MPDTIIKLWCWLEVKSNHRINHWMNLFDSFCEKLLVLPRGPVCWDPFSITIGRNYCDLPLCPTFLWLRLKVSISWICSNSPSFSQILSQEHVWTLRGTKRYLSDNNATHANLSHTDYYFSWNLRTTLHIKVTVSYFYFYMQSSWPLAEQGTDVS